MVSIPSTICTALPIFIANPLAANYATGLDRIYSHRPPIEPEILTEPRSDSGMRQNWMATRQVDHQMDLYKYKYQIRLIYLGIGLRQLP